MITKRQALEACRDLWDWLADDINRTKCDYRGIDQFHNQCPCCEYVYGQRRVECLGYEWDEVTLERIACVGCPLASLWPQGCMTAGSVYQKWLDSRIDRAFYARQIADAAREELTKLSENDSQQNQTNI